jgi:hypothetical protein
MFPPLAYTSTLEMEATISSIMLILIYSEDHNLVRSEAVTVMLIKKTNFLGYEDLTLEYPDDAGSTPF